MNDVHVVGLIMGTVFIEDISIDVPHETTVIIPSDKAAKSKDLWRLISQRQLFRLTQGPFMDFPRPTQVVSPTSVAEMAQLREENRQLAAQNQQLLLAMTTQGGKLDAILGMLASGQLTQAASPVGPVQSPTRAKPVYDVVEIEVPTYIPSEIKPKDVESHLEVQAETSAGTGVSGASEALRALRKKATR